MFLSILRKLSKYLLISIMLVIPSVGLASITDIKFGQYQVADSQWNVSACLYTSSCQIYSKQPGTAYKIPWTSGQVQWANGDYLKFELSGNSSFPYLVKQYDSNGNVKSTLGTGKIVNMGPDYFFFVGNDNNTGQLFSGSSGMSNTSGVTWTGTLNPTIEQANAYAASSYSTTPLAPGQTAGPPPPVPTAIYNSSSNVYITNHYPTSNNSLPGEGASNAFDNNPNTKYLNFDKQNAGVTVKLNVGRKVSGFTLTTANDFSGRDPTSYKLYGSNDGVNWSLIQEGALSLSESRFWTSPMITVSNANAYVYYYVFFPTTKSGEGCGLDCDSMQIAEITFYYDANDATTSTPTGTGSVTNPGTAPTPVYSSSINPSQAMRRAANLAETNGHNANVNIVGSNNVVSIQQIGGGHYVSVGIIGNSNGADILQTTSTSSRHYLETSIIGNTNSLILQQRDTGKNAFVNVDGDDNTLTVNQKGLGNHYLDISLIGDDHTAAVIQDGSGNHAATVQLENGGGPWNFTLNQTGSTSKIYSLPHSMSDGSTVSGICNIVSGCNLTVNQ